MTLSKSEFMKLLGDWFEFQEGVAGIINSSEEWGEYSCSDGWIWFKEKDIFPKVFETEHHTFTISKNGYVEIEGKALKTYVCLTKEEAVEFAKKIQEKK